MQAYVKKGLTPNCPLKKCKYFYFFPPPPGLIEEDYSSSPEEILIVIAVSYYTSLLTYLLTLWGLEILAFGKVISLPLKYDMMRGGGGTCPVMINKNRKTRMTTFIKNEVQGIR